MSLSVPQSMPDPASAAVPVPNAVQTALLFDDHALLDLQAFAQDFQAQQAAQGVHFNLVEAVPEHAFVRLFGANDLMITIEQTTTPLSAEPFRNPLASPYTALASPKAAEAVAAHRSGVLIDVSQGVFPDDDTINGFLDQIGFPKAGQSQKEFLLRLETLKSLTRSYGEHRQPSLVHWTQSNQLLDYQTFVTLSGESMPSLLNIHPRLFSDKTDAQGQWVGFSTFGAAHFLGREIRFNTAPIAWGNLYEYALVFLRFTASQDGYVVPHGHTFGDDNGLSIAVRHLDAEADSAGAEGGEPVYELTLLQSAKFGYECPPDLMPVLGDDGDEPVADLNPDDPVDRAILQRLAERGGTTIQPRTQTVREDDPGWEPINAPEARPGGFGRRRSPPSA